MVLCTTQEPLATTMAPGKQLQLLLLLLLLIFESNALLSFVSKAVQSPIKVLSKCR